MNFAKLILLVLITIIFYGCGHTTQITSGEDYLARHQSESVLDDSNSSQHEGRLRKSIIEAASIEPTLAFPARIGIARLEYGNLSQIPQEEVDAWIETQKKLGDSFGEFVPVNILVTKMASNPSKGHIDSTIDKIRIGAARQHLDVVLIYEVHNNTERNGNVLRLGALTIIGGYFLPSESLTAEGYANAILIDVVQGYPYGTAQTMVEKDEIATTWGASGRRHKMQKEITNLAAIKLTDEVEDMFLKLRYELAESRVE